MVLKSESDIRRSIGELEVTLDILREFESPGDVSSYAILVTEVQLSTLREVLDYV